MRAAEILREVARKRRLSAAEIKVRRDYAAARARHEFYYRAMCETKLSLAVIASVCGAGNRATVIYGAGAYALRHQCPFPRGVPYRWQALQRAGKSE